jgi:hypothetical protein
MVANHCYQGVVAASKPLLSILISAKARHGTQMAYVRKMSTQQQNVAVLGSCADSLQHDMSKLAMPVSET